jgi:ABC-type Fe3+ transport system permease subunit
MTDDVDVWDIVLSIAMSGVFFTISELIRQQVSWLWRWYAVNLLWVSIATGIGIPLLNLALYGIGDLFGADLRTDPFTDDLLTDIILTFIVCFLTWMLIVLSVFFLRVVIPKARQENRRNRRPPKDPT